MERVALEQFEVLEPVRPHFARWEQCFSHKAYDRGEFVWWEGGAADRYSFLIDGFVKIVTSHDDGRATVVNLFGPGESLGHGAVLRQIPYLASAVALTPCQIAWVDRRDFDRLCDEHPDVRQRLTQMVIDCNQRLVRRIHDLSASSAEQRMALVFQHFVSRWGVQAGAYVSVPHLLRGDLAELINVREETAIRLMRQWQSDGVVETRKDCFIVDPARLAPLAE